MLRSPIVEISGSLRILASINYQSVRWRRKPRWLPVAKSKLFRVPERTITPLEERVELLRLHNNYRTQERAIRKYLHDEVKKEVAGQNITHMSPEEEAEDLAHCAKLNEIWNNDIAKIREQRLAEKSKVRRQEIAEEIERKNALKLQQLAEAEAKIRLLMVESKTFITRENIDSAIEEALTNITDYNFSIDVDGNLHKGRKSEQDAVKSIN